MEKYIIPKKGLVRLEQKPFEILPFGKAGFYRMIGGLAETFDDLHCSVCVLGRVGDDFLEK